MHLEDEKKPEMAMDKGSQVVEKQIKFEKYFKKKRISYQMRQKMILGPGGWGTET